MCILLENLLTDKNLLLLTNSGILVEQLKEIIPPLAHRLLILQQLNQTTFSTPSGQIGNDALSSNQVNCTICNKSINSTWISIWGHMRYQHFVTQTRKLWECPFCKSMLQRFRNFKLHVKGHLNQNISSKPLPTSMSTENVLQNQEENLPINQAEQNDSIECDIRPDLEDKISKLLSRAVKFVVNLKSNGKLSLVMCKDIMTSVTDLINDFIDVSKDICINSVTVEQSTDLLTQLKNPFSSVESDYLLRKYLEHFEFLIPAQEVVLDSHLKRKNGKSVVCFDTLQYIPIDQVLKKVLGLPGLMESIIKINSNIQNDVYISPVCGKYLKQKLAKFDVPVVFLIFYYDEVEVCNPLGSRHGQHKLGNCYFSILNSFNKYSSKLDNIFLCCSFKSTLLKQYPISRILQQPISAITNLCEETLKISSESYTGEVQVCLGQVTGDNLGLHQIFGFSESFVSNYPCRFCRMPRFKCLKSGKDSALHRRTKINYEEDLKIGNLAKTGVKVDSVFNSVPNFHVTENFCPDVMHDILEGVAPLNMKLVLKHLIQTGVTNIEQINNRISAHNYGHLGKDKPSPLSLGTIESSETLFGQSAGQTYCLLQNFAFLFGDKIEPNSPHWRLFLTFLDIMDIIMSPHISDSSLPYLEALIEDHHNLFQIVSNRSLRPKHHHMLHYPEAIRQIGPLLCYWSMRFEARQNFSSKLRRSDQTIKILQSRWQIGINLC